MIHEPHSIDHDKMAIDDSYSLVDADEPIRAGAPSHSTDNTLHAPSSSNKPTCDDDAAKTSEKKIETLVQGEEFAVVDAPSSDGSRASSTNPPPSENKNRSNIDSMLETNSDLNVVSDSEEYESDSDESTSIASDDYDSDSWSDEEEYDSDEWSDDEDDDDSDDEWSDDEGNDSDDEDDYDNCSNCVFEGTLLLWFVSKLWAVALLLKSKLLGSKDSKELEGGDHNARRDRSSHETEAEFEWKLDMQLSRERLNEALKYHRKLMREMKRREREWEQEEKQQEERWKKYLEEEEERKKRNEREERRRERLRELKRALFEIPMDDGEKIHEMLNKVEQCELEGIGIWTVHGFGEFGIDFDRFSKTNPPEIPPEVMHALAAYEQSPFLMERLEDVGITF